MGICESKTANQIKSGPENNIKQKEMLIKNNKGEAINIPVPFDVTSKAIKSLCKITLKYNNMIIYATGFFMKISDKKKYLITNNHVISQEKINWDIEIEIHSHKIMQLILNNRDIQFFPGAKDITLIEIKDNDSIYNDIEFLDYDDNYRKGYKHYVNGNIIIVQHPLGKNAFSSCGN